VKVLVGVRRNELQLEPTSEALAECLDRFEKTALAVRPGLMAETRAFLTIGHRCRRTWREARRLLGRRARREGVGRDSLRRTRRAVRLYLGTARRLAVFHFYERVFAMWHAVHLPLCYLLFATATVHVLAVHMY